MRKFIDNVVIYLLCAFIILMPIWSSDIKVLGKFAVGDILLFLLILVYLIKVILNRDIKGFFINIGTFICNKFYLCFIIITVMMLYSITYAYYQSDALSESVRFITYMALMFIITFEVTDYRKLLMVFKSLIATLTIQVGAGLIQFILGVASIGPYSIGQTRISATMDNPNAFGAFLVIFLFPIAFCALKEKEKKKKGFFIGLAVLIIVNIGLSYTRNALVGVAFGILVLAIFYSYKFVIAMGGLAAIALLIPSIGQRVKEIFDMSQNLSRIQLIECSFRIIKDYPINGIGNGNFRQYYNLYRQYYPEFQIGEHVYYVVHNSFLKIWAELGIIALAIFISGLVIGFTEIKKVVNRFKESPIKNFYMGFLVSFLAFLFMNMIDHFIIVPKVITFFWILLALCQSILINKINID